VSGSRGGGGGGKVYLVGGGPGDPELLTRKAARVLAEADIVLHDALVSREVLALANPRAEIVDVGKRSGRKLLTQEEINSLLVASARVHGVVVRLKGGDPMLFAHGAEEIDALRDAGIECEIVPGITAGIAAAAAAGISLTDRRVSSQALFTTIQRGTENRSIQWAGISSTTTLIIYMPGTDYGEVARQLRDAGWPEDMPCAIVSRVGSAEQVVRTSILARLGEETALAAPALMIVGRVVRREAAEMAAGVGAAAAALESRAESWDRGVAGLKVI
jgi:uroporphyrin-III C-methyltransferase